MKPTYAQLMAKDNHGVSSDHAAIIHELLGEAFEASLRQQLLSGEFNAAMLGKVLEWLKHNNVSVVESADDRLKGLAKIFRAESSDEDLLNYLDGVKAREV